MYLPPAFRMDDGAAIALVDAHPLAQLVVVAADGRPTATPVPLVRRGDALIGHLARGNELTRHTGPALAIFSAADAYVSPRWYANKPIDGKVVPTWNYTTVHVHGTLVTHDDPTWLLDVVTFLTDRMEAAEPATGEAPWKVSDAPDEYVDGLLRAIVGIEIVDLRIEGKAKLSQNKGDVDRARVAHGLAGGSPAAQAVARAMQDSAG